MLRAASTSDSNLLSLGGRSWHFPFDLSFPTVYSRDSLDLCDDFYVNDECQKRSRLFETGFFRLTAEKNRAAPCHLNRHLTRDGPEPESSWQYRTKYIQWSSDTVGGRRGGVLEGGAGGVFMTELSQLPHFSLSSARLMSPRRAERCHFLLSGSGIFSFWILPLSESELCGRRNASTWPQLRILLEM